MISLSFPKRALIASAAWLAPACVWAHLDAIGSSAARPDADTSDGPAESDVPDTASESATADVRPDAPDMDVAPLETSAGDDVSTSSPCSAAIVSARQWTFDANSEGWTVFADSGTSASLSWTGAMGNPTGALQFDGTPGTVARGAWLYYGATPLGDLSHRLATAWVWLDFGANPHLKLYVQTGAFSWADSGTLVLPLRSWTCVSLDLSAPSYNQPNYDPTNVVRLGFETQGTTPFRLYVDSVRIY